MLFAESPKDTSRASFKSSISPRPVLSNIEFCMSILLRVFSDSFLVSRYLVASSVSSRVSRRWC